MLAWLVDDDGLPSRENDGKLLGHDDTLGATPTAELRVLHGKDAAGALLVEQA